MKLLYAEDEMSMSEAVVDILTFHKYIVDAVYDGADALAYAEAEQYDGIILDIMMPKMDGYEAIMRIRENPLHENLPLIALTTKAMQENRDKCLEIGASDYIAKPVEPDQLISLIKVWLY